MTFTGASVCFFVFTVRGLFAFNDETTLLNQFGAKLSLLVSCLATLGFCGAIIITLVPVTVE